jgi:hypothetical protein
MYYILYSDKIRTVSPEIEYNRGQNIPFREGYFLIGVDEKKQSAIIFDINGESRVTNSITIYDSTIFIEGELYKVIPTLTFNHPVRAEMVFLNLKVTEFKNVGFNFYLPILFQKYVDRFDCLNEQYPECII